MDRIIFSQHINLARIRCSPSYAFGYCYGLRRCYHGEKFGEDFIIDRILNHHDGSMNIGLRDGLAGRPPRAYCTRDGNCTACSLLSNGKDCGQVPLWRKKRRFRKYE